MERKKMYSLPEVAKKLGFNYVTVWGWAKKGILPTYNFNGNNRVSSRDLKAFIKAGYKKEGGK